MDNKDLITRFAEDCFRFEALHQEIDGLIAEADSEVLAYEYEDLANQAVEIVLKLSANGNNVGEHFYRYYVERLEYIIDYFRALLDYEETPLAEDEPNELDDEPAAEVGFEGFPADCAFPPPPTVRFRPRRLLYLKNGSSSLPRPPRTKRTPRPMRAPPWRKTTAKTRSPTGSTTRTTPKPPKAMRLQTTPLRVLPSLTFYCLPM